jgi:8-oxo-dGTP diphosphatase
LQLRATICWWLKHESQLQERKMARAPVVTAGGIVLREGGTPLIAVVRLRKRDQWVLPKGKLDEGETPRDAALREVLEETGHEVSVHEFLGTLVYEAAGRSKIVHYWRMAADPAPSRKLMDDVTAVDWLPLEAALERLSRSSERAFLANVGPLALAAAATARSRRPKAKRPAPEQRRGRQPAAPKPLPAKPVQAPAPLQPDLSPAMARNEPQVVASGVMETSASAAIEFATAPPLVEVDSAAPQPSQPDNDHPAAPAQGGHRNLVQKMRDWLRRAA